MTAGMQTEKPIQAARLLENRVAIVTGASRGIGAAIALLFAEHGAAVGINYHSNQAAAQQVVDAIASRGGKALAVQADVREMSQVESMVQQVTEAFAAVDTLVLNANASFKIAPFMEQSWEEFEAKLVGELKSAFYPCKAVVPSMIEHQRGCIIAISSITSRHAEERFFCPYNCKIRTRWFCKKSCHIRSTRHSRQCVSEAYRRYRARCHPHRCPLLTTARMER